MRPLHRIANWDIAGGWAPFIAIVVGWMAFGFGIWADVVLVDNAPRQNNQGALAVLLTTAFFVLTPVSIYRLWQWEERHEVRAEDRARRIAELEKEVFDD